MTTVDDEPSVLREYRAFRREMDEHLGRGHYARAVKLALRTERFGCARDLLGEYRRDLTAGECGEICFLMLEHVGKGPSSVGHDPFEQHIDPFVKLLREYAGWLFDRDQLERCARALGRDISRFDRFDRWGHPSLEHWYPIPK